MALIVHSKLGMESRIRISIKAVHEVRIMIRLQAELLEQAEALQAGWEAIGVFLIMTVWGTTDGPL